jgi:hypothetical protein
LLKLINNKKKLLITDEIKEIIKYSIPIKAGRNNKNAKINITNNALRE